MKKRIPVKQQFNNYADKLFQELMRFEYSKIERRTETQREQVAVTKYITEKAEQLNKKMEKIFDSKMGYKMKLQKAKSISTAISRYTRNIINGNFLSKSKRDFLKSLKKQGVKERALEKIQELLKYGVDVDDDNWKDFVNPDDYSHLDKKKVSKFLSTFYSGDD